MTSEKEYRIEDAVKDPGESLKVSVDCYALCAVKWHPNEPYTSGEYVRPVVPNGFAYECTTTGLSGNREPKWPTVIAATKTDGSATWTCRAAGAAGLNPITVPSAQSDPTGLTITSVTVSESYKLLATYADGIAGQAYDVVFSFTLDGVPRIARQRVEIAKR
jgi:hypothetical protein